MVPKRMMEKGIPARRVYQHSIFCSSRFRRLPLEARVYTILVASKLKPAADFEVGEELAGDLERILRRLKIRYEKGEYDEEHGRDAMYYISRSVLRARRLKVLDGESTRGFDSALVSEIGKLYGVPECCIRHFIRSSRDSSPGQIIPRDAPAEYGYLFHLPCSKKCAESRSLGRAIRETLKRFEPITAFEWSNKSHLVLP
ncbi:MAG: hypothetical protein ABSB29_06490 [Nitrososphaerales archaeon]|jgi:hypothetical protein